MINFTCFSGVSACTGVVYMGCILGQKAAYALTARRNNSLSSFNRLFAFGFIALVSLGIAVAFACLGAWLILPFAGVELLVLGWAFRFCERHARDYERLTINDDVLQIEVAQAGRVRRFEFNRWWAQVISEREWPGRRLALRSHGRQIEFGRYLTPDQRRMVAGDLKSLLSGG